MFKSSPLVHLRAAIFDMDGVVTDTAELHFLSWKETFDHFLKQSSGNKSHADEFSKNDYLKYVDGVMRDDGIKNFLGSKNLLPNKLSEIDSLIGHLGRLKDDSFLSKVDQIGVKCFESTRRLITNLRNWGKKVAVISSSKYCKQILIKADVYDLFDSVISGQVLVDKNIPGKPDPGIFLEAAKTLEIDPGYCMVVEDALLGVKAGKAGDFGLVIGIDRNKVGTDLYRLYGADIVVNDLEDLSLPDVKQWFEEDVNPCL